MKRKKNYYALVKDEGKENSYSMYLYDTIHDGLDINWETWEITESKTSGKAFRDQLAEIPDDAEINLYINSSGGDVYEAAAIYSNLARHNGKVTAIVDGCANSAAFTVLQAADHRVMNVGTSAIIHNAWTIAAGNANDLRKEADQLDALMETITDVLMERCTLKREKLVELLDAETLLAPQDAMAYGLIDEIGKPARNMEEDGTQADVHDAAQDRISELKQQLAGALFKAQAAEAFNAASPHRLPDACQDGTEMEMRACKPGNSKKEDDKGSVGFNAFFYAE